VLVDADLRILFMNADAERLKRETAPGGPKPPGWVRAAADENP
jgi:hypothetical protein